ncbi:MAG: DEAD/DEAH box helicase family protein [Nanoarchaeota archaeon]|nr:DEAD/DEAH box helicase family protein [Nanoarchaeota archaeon]MBU1027760.1 DEAD/DEAH box helicase family protein [Nanoarchaeota archaeon]
MWSLYENGKFLEPLVFSNGKSQEDIVKEVLNEIKKGNNILFIKGVCGTGKSAIALNIAKELGKASIVVPGKNLQSQYKKDYEKQKYLLKENKEKLKISIITGRANHVCKFLKNNKESVPTIKKEVDAKLNDIFDGKSKELDNKFEKDISANNNSIPCKIEIKEKNYNKLKHYIKQNKYIDVRNFTDIKHIKRVPVASVCPYWSPVLPSEYELKGPIFDKARKREYEGLSGIKFNYYERKKGCGFYEQFDSFITSDILVFNSLKYKLESLLNRKPFTEVEIIDECDDFLDSFSNQKNINLDRFQNSLTRVISVNQEVDDTIAEIFKIISSIKKDKKIKQAIISKEILPLKKTGIYDLLRMILNCPKLFEEADDENYVFDVEETALMFKDFMDETYVTVNKIENNLFFSLVTTNLAKKFKEMINKSKNIVLMSGTVHSEEVLKDIFGLENFKILEAEVENQGKIQVKRTGKEIDCKYSNFSNGKNTRKDYLKALDLCVEIAKKPCLVHVNSFADLPTQQEIKLLDLKNLIAKDNFRFNQEQDKIGRLVEEFKKGYNDVLFSTRVSRGIDFPGSQCNSIIFTKYPNPNVQDAFWKILNRANPQHYWAFYKDKARRELWQKVYRGVRSKNDHIFVLSPDSRVLDAFENYG